MDALTAVATPHGLKLLNSTLKNSATRYTLIGATSHDAPSPGVFYTAAIETSYYDSNGVLTFVVELPAAQDFNRYLHGIAIIDASDQVVINTPTPKIALASGIGGMVTIKAAVTGEPGEVVFKASDYVTAPELRDNWLIPASSSKRGLIRIATAAEITTGSATDVAVNPAQLNAIWTKHRDVLGELNVHGSIRTIFQGRLIHSGPPYEDAPAGTGDFSKGDINAGASTNIFLHLRTPMEVPQRTGMFRFHLYGYAYGAEKIIDERIAGYCHPSGVRHTHSGGDLSPAAYQGSDNKIYLRISLTSSYYLTLAVDSQKVAIGAAFQKGSLHPIISKEETL